MLTSVRLLTSVHPEMDRQGALEACAVVTVLTSVRLLTSVYPHMRLQGAHPACAVVTVLASVRLLTRVHSQVLRHGALFACAVVTVLTSVRFLTGVYSQVRCQGALVTCAVSAVLANMQHHRDVRALNAEVKCQVSSRLNQLMHGACMCTNDRRLGIEAESIERGLCWHSATSKHFFLRCERHLVLVKALECAANSSLSLASAKNALTQSISKSMHAVKLQTP